VHRILVVVLALGAALAMSGCGGGGSGSSPDPDPIPTGAPITVTGVATFDRVPTLASTGLDYNAIVAKPIRNAVVQVRTAGGTHVLSTATTNAFGGYSIQAPSNASVRVVILAAMGTPSSPTKTRVVDNTAGNAIYATYITVATPAVNLAGQNIHAPSGWVGTKAAGNYSAPRSAGPFAILDTAHDVLAMIDGADPGVVTPSLVLGWSVSNSSATIGTSFFDPAAGRILLLGAANSDTDEYDDHVVAHEIGHWFEHNFSRADSLGGGHGDGDILDETVAFGEGFGNAFSGMATRNRFYRDTIGSKQNTTGLNLDLEADATSDVAQVSGSDARLLDGGWSEGSIQEILFDIFDGGDSTTDADADGIAAGFKPIYDVLTGAQRTTAGFTNIYSFLTHLKSGGGVSAPAIDALAAAENIGAFNQFEQTGVGLRRQTVVPSNGTVVNMDIDTRTLQTHRTYGDIDTDFPGNKLYNWMLFSATVSTGTNYRIKATPTNAAGDVIIRMAGGIEPSEADIIAGGPERLNFKATRSQVVFAVGSFANPTIPTGVTPFTIQIGIPAVVGKPSPAATPVVPDESAMPQSNG